MPHNDMSFPSQEERRQLNLNEKNWRLYSGDHYKVFGIKDYFVDDTRKERKLYIAANLPALVTEYFGDLTVGEGAMFLIDDENAADKLNEIITENKLDETLFQLALDQSTFGYGVLRVRPDAEDPNKPVIEFLDPNIYYPTYDARDSREPAQVVLGSYIIDPLDKNNKNGLIYKAIYKRVSGVVTLQYELRIVKADKTEGDSVDKKLYGERFPELLQDPITIEGIDRIPVWQVDNMRRGRMTYGKSDYKDFEPQLEEINNRITHISIQLIKHMNARLAVPPSTFQDEEGNDVLVKDVDIVEVAKDDIVPQYITNSNPLIEDAFSYIDMLIQQALGIAKVPPEMVRPESPSGNEKVEAMRIRLFPSLRKVARKRIAIESTMKEALKYALAITGTETESNIRIVWDDIIPVDMSALTTQMVQRKTAGLISTRTAIQTLDGVSEDEAVQEQERIAAEEPAVEPFNPLVG